MRILFTLAAVAVLAVGLWTEASRPQGRAGVEAPSRFAIQAKLPGFSLSLAIG